MWGLDAWVLWERSEVWKVRAGVGAGSPGAWVHWEGSGGWGERAGGLDACVIWVGKARGGSLDAWVLWRGGLGVRAGRARGLDTWVFQKGSGTSWVRLVGAGSLSSLGEEWEVWGAWRAGVEAGGLVAWVLWESSEGWKVRAGEAGGL